MLPTPGPLGNTSIQKVSDGSLDFRWGETDVARIEALVKPALLLWARRTAGFDLDQAAKKAGVKPDKLLAWEEGRARPTVVQLQKLAAVYRRPLGIFYLPQPPKDFKAMRDFRRLVPAGDHEFSPELLLEFRRAHYRRLVALDLATEMGQLPPALNLRANLSDDGETVADRLRRALQVTMAEQISWGQEYRAFLEWKGALERLGILVFQFPHVPVEEARGFSISERELPAIAVNSADAIRAKIFTLFHELAHLVLREEGVCDLLGSPRLGSEAIEAFCNRLSAAVLVPRQDLLSLPQVAQHEGSRPWSDEEIARLSNRYLVSQEVIVRRLVTVGKATKAFYERKREELHEAYTAALTQRRFGRSTPAGTAVNRLGLLFTRLVLDAYHTEAISAGAVSDYLDIRLKHLDAVEKTAFGPQPIGATAR